MKKNGIRKSFLTLSLLGVSFALCSCFASPGSKASSLLKTVNIVGSDGEEVGYTVEIGSTFDYQIEENEMLFVGCFEKEEGKGKKYVMHDGKSVTWDSSMPETLYAYYVSKDRLSFSANPINEKNTLSISGSGTNRGVVSFDEAYVAYMDDSNLKALTRISFDYKDVASEIYDNWSGLIITCNDKEIYNNSLRANINFVNFSEDFELEAKDLAKGLIISLSHSNSNLSGNSSTLKNIKIGVQLLTEKQLDEEITFEKRGKHFEHYLPDGSQMLRYTTMSVCPGGPIPYFVKKLIEKYNQCDLSVTFTISSYGKKPFFMENWGDSWCKLLDENGNELQSKFVKLQNNSGYSNNSCTINMVRQQAKSLSRSVVLLEYPSKNASAQPYYTESIKVEYDFTAII